MDSVEELNYVPHYQELLFQNKDNPTDAANVHRKCLVQTYSASLQLLDDQAAADLLKLNLENYSKLVDENDEVFNNHVKSTSSSCLEWQSGLDSVNMETILKPLPCNKNGLQCQKTDNLTEDGFQEFLKQMFINQMSSNQPDLSNEPKMGRRIAKSFAPQCCNSKDKKIDKVPIVEKSLLLPEQDHNAHVPLHPLKDQEEVKNANAAFKTAREELNIQNMKKFGCRTSSQGSQMNNQVGTGGQKRKLGTRRNVQNKFVSPMLSNNSSSEELAPKSEEWPVDELMDERLKNIEPRMVELIRSEIMDSGAVVDWDDIAGLEFAKTAIQEAVVWPMLRPDIFTGLRKPPKGILLFGPPGTGKTLIGKCVASQSKSTFFSISASSLTSKWVGDGEKMVRALFAVARCHQPAVIFIDEIDSLLSQRSETEHESSRRIKTEFLVQLDGATTDNDERILVIGATNRPQELDEAARRRFVKRLYIPLPESQARLQLVTRLMAQERHNLNEEDIQKVSQMSDGYSGADMKNLCSEASLGPIRCIDLSKIQSIQAAEVRPVSMDDFIKAFTRVKSSVSPKDLEQYLIWNKTYGSGCAF